MSHFTRPETPPPKTRFFSLTPAENRHFHQPFFTFEREVTWAQSDLLHEWRLDPKRGPALRTGSAPGPAGPERVPILAISMGYMPPALPRSDLPERSSSSRGGVRPGMARIRRCRVPRTRALRSRPPHTRETSAGKTCDRSTRQSPP